MQRTCRPVVEDVLGDVCRRVVGGESEVLCFPADQDEAEMHLWQKQRQFTELGDPNPHYSPLCRLCWNSCTSSNLF